MANNNTAVMGKTKRSTDNLIDDAIAQQDGWLSRRRHFTRRFLKSLNDTEEEQGAKPEKKLSRAEDEEPKKSVLREYWFPIACALIVLFVLSFFLP